MNKPERIVTDEVLYDVKDHIATITLNAPERMNTISGPMLGALSQCLLEADADRDVRCVILTGTGRAFCAGLDLRAQTQGKGLAIGGSGAGRHRHRPAQHAADSPARDEQAGDLRHQWRRCRLWRGHRASAATSASWRSRPSSRCPSPSAASFPRSGGTWLLPRLLGWSKAAEIIFTGRTLSRGAMRRDGPCLAKSCPMPS